MTVKELVDLLMDLPDDEQVFIPDFNSNNNYQIDNVILTNRGVLLDYTILK